ncbi:FdhF/YdeP family oxidoreductase [Jannaschia sp. R86511]|uniref:FdhF/YdeP family oxidoreductase n=1 Tax=Jannaschia sp. R86511 TaxID=3093853 RepID=UPI0036D24A92
MTSDRSHHPGATAAPAEDHPDDPTATRTTAPGRWATGVPAIVSSAAQGVLQDGADVTARTWARLNQTSGFDCPSCAWPDPAPGHRSPFEFCESGAKAVAHEATARTVTPGFLARHPLRLLATRSDWWLEKQGRLTEPLVRRPGSDRYEPIGWDEALDLVADALREVDPAEAVFYTSGRASNEAAFVHQLLARGLGSNNLPDCSNMCHEASGVALNEVLGSGKGSVTLDSLEHADLVLLVGHNVATNAPRMLSALELAKERGASVVAVNPLREAGLLRFKNPQRPLKALGHGTDVADEFLQVRLGGDLALFQLLGKRMLQREAAAPGTVLDTEFLDRFTSGLDAHRTHLLGLDEAELARATGLADDEVERVVDLLCASQRTVVVWAMGVTQHVHAVDTVQEFVNLLMLRGMLGRHGAGVLPVRGHSNVQGNRTVGISEAMPEEFLAALGEEFGFDPPREPGVDVAGTLEALQAGRVRVFVGLGGNFVRAVPDSAAVERAFEQVDLTVQLSTTLNRTHAHGGRTALVLPVIGRTERDTQAGPDGRGADQVVTVEDSEGRVHASRGRLDPPSPQVRSETAVLAGLARRLFVGPDGATRPGRPHADWDSLVADYSRIRSHVSRVLPSLFTDYETRATAPGGFLLPHAVRDERRFDTDDGRAHFTVHELQYPQVPEGRLLLQTMRSHDQFNTTVYGYNDRYRGIKGGRKVVLVHADDLAARGLADGDLVDLVSEFHDGERRLDGLRAVAYPTARGCVAAYFPEANVLVPAGHLGRRSRTPASKSVVVRLDRA